MKASDYIKKGMAVITADDFAISDGVDSAIIALLRKKKIHRASIFTTTLKLKYLWKELTQKNIDTSSIGLHLDFTFGRSIVLRQKSLLTNEIGDFKHSFIAILLMSVFKKKKLQELVRREIDGQILALKEFNPKFLHIDGHQHTHMIPLIFKELVKACEKHNIPNIRYINETIFQWKIFNPFNIKNTVKLFLLRFLGIFCKYKADTYFVSILNTCKISANVIKQYKVPIGYKKVEIMLHPGNSTKDAGNTSKEKKHLLSLHRDIEKHFANHS
ncbi:MAG: putative glycoside hydrolase/deacetylase ChbG (UPF0249 family) [Candidatus Deianiraeaceae bacterium]|jgi:predicted glycoside hydrolase/deacetylase ChbG (UPF0249 family)